MDDPSEKPTHDARKAAFHLLAEYSSDVLYTQDLTAEQKITYVSPAVEDLLGYTVEEVIGMPLKKLLTPESHEHQARVLREDMAQHNDLSHIAKMLEVQLVCKDGSVIWGEAHARLMANDQGEPIGIQGVMRDITRRKEAEERERQYHRNTEWLRNSAIELMQLSTVGAIYRYIGESLSQMVDQGVTIVNEITKDGMQVIPRHIYGLKYHTIERFIKWLGFHPVGKEYPLTQQFAQLYRQEKITPFPGGLTEFSEGFHTDRVLKKIEQYLNLKQIYTIGLKRDNRLLAAIHILKFNHPEISNLRFVETFLNQTSIALQRKMLENELRQAKEKAEENEKLKTAFLGNMSHEIRSPLNIILGYVQMLDKPNLSNDDRQSYIRAINQSSEQLLEIINDILSMSRLETGQQQLQNQPFNLNTLIEETHLAYENRARRNDIRFQCYTPLPEEQALLKSDETKIRQILNNLLNNAFKFTDEGMVEMGYRLYHNRLELYISDTGIGIPEEYREKIFERFIQVENSNHRKYEGTGLGLSISRGLAHLLGGEIRVHSRVGHGTTFYLSLPASLIISEVHPGQ